MDWREWDEITISGKVISEIVLEVRLLRGTIGTVIGDEIKGTNHFVSANQPLTENRK